MIDARDLAELAWKVQPKVSPWAAVQVVLVAVGTIAAIHILHHAIHYPFREKLRRSWARLQERRRRPLYLPATWKGDVEASRLKAHLLERRPRRIRE